jgi:hypothetical protein
MPNYPVDKLNSSKRFLGAFKQKHNKKNNWINLHR